MNSPVRAFRRIMCRFGRHKQLDVIQTFGAAEHVGCPDCGRRYAIHHGERVILPWDSGFSQLYSNMGFDTEAPLAKWQKHRTRRAPHTEDR